MQPSSLSLWLAVLSIGIITFALRLSFLFLAHKLEIPPPLQRALRFVPVAALSALILPDLLLRNSVLDPTPSNLRFVAGIIAAIVAWRTKNVLLTIAIGMVSLWVMQWIRG